MAIVARLGCLLSRWGHELRLHTREWGSGDQVAVLVHGMMGESRQFWEVGPALAIGQSLGGLVVAAALPRLEPQLAIYVDIPFEALDSDEQPQDAVTLTDLFDRAKAGRTAARLARTRTWWKQRDCEVEEEAARLFDVPTAVALELSQQWDAMTPPSTAVPSLVIHADPSDYVSANRVAELAELGFAVRGVKGAGHSVWYGFFDEYMDVLDDWLAEHPAEVLG